MDPHLSRACQSNQSIIFFKVARARIIIGKIYFATGNQGKIEEMKPLFEEREVEIEQVDVDVPEIDTMDVEDVARRKAWDSYNKAVEKGFISEDDTLIVEDTGFYVESLGGFPGAEAAYFSRRAGVGKLLPLLEDEENRKAYFKTALGVFKNGEVSIFSGKLNGRVPEKIRGDSHDYLPYNSFFILNQREEDKSLAEKSMHKNKNFHRTKATIKFLNWLK